jgi:hypothetical protein
MYESPVRQPQLSREVHQSISRAHIVDTKVEQIHKHLKQTSTSKVSTKHINLEEQIYQHLNETSKVNAGYEQIAR